MTRKIILSIALLLMVLSPLFSQSHVKETKHNLSVTGPGRYKSLDETEVCKFCHTPHSAAPMQQLWNHQLSAEQNYKTYRSASLESVLGEYSPMTIEGSSRLCLSCHDGTVALGAMVKDSKAQRKDKSNRLLGTLPPTAKGYIGTDLSGSHPISFMVNESKISKNNLKDSLLGNLADMTSDPDVKLDENNMVQCTSCHDAHSDRNYASSGIHFWAKPTFNDVCLVCHRL